MSNVTLERASIVCLSSIDWSFNRQNPQETALAFARRGHRVLFVENTGVRRPGWRDLPRLWLRLRNWLRARGGVVPATDGVSILSPLLLPFPYSRIALSLNTRWLARAIRRWLGNENHAVIVVTFLPTPLARAVTTSLNPALVVYYCIDRFAKSSRGARKIVASEQCLIRESDLVMVTSEVLYEQARQIRPDVHLLSSGVRVDDFERARQTLTTSTNERRASLRPIIGYVGSLRRATDLDLLARVADRAPDLDFVLIGPRFVNVNQLAARPNMTLVEPLSHDDAMHRMVNFDVGMLPYLIDEFTAAIMPVKLKEYLAAGLPVVATPLPAVRQFAAEHPGVVTFARDADEFVAALRSALCNGHPEEVERRIAIARRYDWNGQMARMIDLIDAALLKRNDGGPLC